MQQNENQVAVVNQEKSYTQSAIQYAKDNPGKTIGVSMAIAIGIYHYYPVIAPVVKPAVTAVKIIGPPIYEIGKSYYPVIKDTSTVLFQRGVNAVQFGADKARQIHDLHRKYITTRNDIIFIIAISQEIYKKIDNNLQVTQAATSAATQVMTSANGVMTTIGDNLQYGAQATKSTAMHAVTKTGDILQAGAQATKSTASQAKTKMGDSLQTGAQATKSAATKVMTRMGDSLQTGAQATKSAATQVVAKTGDILQTGAQASKSAATHVVTAGAQATKATASTITGATIGAMGAANSVANRSVNWATSWREKKEVKEVKEEKCELVPVQA